MAGAQQNQGNGGDGRPTDVWLYRLVVGVLGIVVLVATAGAIILTVYDLDIPELLTALGSASVGALAGLLTPLGTSR